MYSSAGLRNKVSLTKNLIIDQTFDGLTVKLNTDMAFDAVEGLGEAAAQSSLILCHAGGFDNQKITGSLKWVAPNDTSNYEIGVIARFQTNDSPDATYYYARCDGDTAKLTKVIDGSFSNLATNAFVLPIDTPVQIELSCVGTTITAVFTCAGVVGSPLTLSQSNSDITSGGLMGLRSLSSAVWFRSFTAEEL